MTTKPRKILRNKDLDDRGLFSRSHRWRLIKAGKFPPPFEFGDNSIGWFDDVIEEYEDNSPLRTYGAEAPYEPGSEVPRRTYDAPAADEPGAA